MVTLFLFLIIACLVVAIVSSRLRGWFVEEIKALSDFLLLLFLRWTSQFGDELTKDGAAEQELWRERRRRDLRGLALRAQQRQEREKDKGH